MHVKDGDINTGLANLTGLTVRSYVTGMADHYAPESVRLAATSIRAFLRFAWIAGLVQTDLAGAVGPVAVHRASGVPKALNRDQLNRLLAVPDRRVFQGARDYAVMVLLSRLGLRASEVADLCLEDFNWRTARVAAKIKGGGRLDLPIPVDVGGTIVDYLQLRPPVDNRHVFLQSRRRALSLTSSAVSQIVVHCARRAGLDGVHAHRLRHTAARLILDAGGGLGEVGQLLGHRSSQVRMMYSSLDLAALRPLTRVWPIGHDDV